jgi:iron complex outermembrane receptor protein
MSKIFVFSIFILMLATLQAEAFQDKNSILKGKVSDSNGKSLPGAAVTIENSFLGIFTNPDGNFIFTGLKDGNYTLKFSFMGYETVVKDVILKDELNLDITLSAKPYLIDEVQISALRAGEHSPMAYSSIDKTMLKSQNTGQDMPYLLSLTPSLIETSEAGNGVGYTGLRIRGTDGNRINVTIDGIPLNDPESQQVFWVDLPDIASSVDNIQVQRGAGTSTNGAGAFGATISLQTTTPDNEPFADMSASYGSFNTLKRMVSAGSGILGGKFALQMRYSDLKSDGYIYRTGSDHRSMFISGVFRNDKSSLRANVIIGEEHTGIGWWGVPKEMLSIDRRYNPSGEYTDEDGNIQYYDNESDNYKQDHFQLIYNRKMSNFLTLNTALHYTKGKGYYEEYREDQPLSEYGLPSFSIGDSVISSSDLIRRKWMSNDFYGLVTSVKYRKERVEASAGGGMNTYSGNHYGNIIWMRNGGNTEKDHRWYHNNAQKAEISIFGKVSYSITDKTSIFGDLQYRYVGYTLLGEDDDLKDLGQTHNFSFFNPKGGLFYSISSNQDTYFSFSVANREPTRSDFKEASGDASATPKAETLYDTEAGYKLRTGKSSIAVNIYGMIYRDQLVPTGQLSDVGYSIMTNVDNSYRLGIELSGAMKMTEYLSWNVNLTLSKNKISNFTEYYTDYNTTDWSSQYLSKNLGTVDIAYSPSVISTSDFTLTITKGLNIHVISKFVGKQYFDNTMSQERTIDPYFVNNLRFDFSPVIKGVKNVELQLLVNNIFNEKYENNAYGGNWYEDGSEKTWSYYFPQAGTNWLARLAVRF